MNFVIELILELVMEGGLEVGKNKKFSKWIRYPLLFLIIIFYSAVILLLIYLGISVYKTNITGGIALLLIAVILLILTVKAFRKNYNEMYK